MQYSRSRRLAALTARWWWATCDYDPATAPLTPAFLRPRHHSADASVPFQSKIVITRICYDAPCLH